MSLPSRYAWLLKEGAPRMLVKALELYGTQEIVGAKQSPIILGWAHELGLDNVYKADEIPWCGLFALICAVRAKKEVPWPPLTYRDALWALNWLKFGSAPGGPADGTVSLTQQLQAASLGDVLVFKRPEGGHVGIYVGETNSKFFVLGGNEGNAVSIVMIDKTRCVGVRRPHYDNPPANIRKVFLNDIGEPVSANEA